MLFTIKSVTDLDLFYSTYHATSLVIVQIHLLAVVTASLARVDKVPSEFDAESDVV